MQGFSKPHATRSSKNENQVHQYRRLRFPNWRMARLVSDRPRVVIAGAGFGGLWAARTIAPFDVDVLLIDQNNYHIFLPLLYQVAAAELEPEEIAYPVRSILRGLPNVQFALTKVERMDPKAKLVKTENRTIRYDYLVLSTGSVPEFFRISGADEHALPLKTLEDGIAIRSQILTCFEKAVHEADHDLRSENADLHDCRWRTNWGGICRCTCRTNSWSSCEGLCHTRFPRSPCGTCGSIR